MSVLIPADPDIAAPETLGSRLVGYFAQLGRAIATTFEGLTVTSSWLFRRPSTLQYPDRIEKPVQEMLPESYRGTLEMDLLRCTGCLLCAKACPIDCLGIDVEKNAASGSREIVRFDIDIGRCMYCGLCTEVCKFDSLRHTTEFETATPSPDGLSLHFVQAPVPVSKHKAGEGPPRRPQGSILAQMLPSAPGRERWGGKGQPSTDHSTKESS